VHRDTPKRFVFDRQRIVVAGEDSVTVGFAIATLRHDGHCVTHVTDTHRPSWDLALRECHLLIASSTIGGATWADLQDDLLDRQLGIALLCITDASRTPPASSAQSRPAVPTLREPFTAEELRAAVRPLLPELLTGSVLARTAVGPAADCG
jgi:DNA-binding NtrC family response regulator